MKKYLFLFLAAGFAACGGNSTAEGEKSSEQAQLEVAETALYNEILQEHDRIMPKLGPLQQMSKKLQASKAEMDQEKHPVVDATVAMISAAEDNMMTWMSELGNADPQKLRATNSHEEIMEILALQEENAALVAKQFEEAEKKATMLLFEEAKEKKGISLTPN